MPAYINFIHSISGTWGEDDDGAETPNVWTGSTTNPPNQQWCQTGATTANINVNSNNSNVTTGGPLWPQTPTGNAAASNATPVSNNNVGSSVPGQGVVNLPADMNRDNEWPTNVNNVASGNNWGDPRGIARVNTNPNDIRATDPRDTRNQSRYHPMMENCDPRITGDPRGISGKETWQTLSEFEYKISYKCRALKWKC